MTNDQLTATLAERVMGWTVAPDRFLTSGRSWIPRWRFNPFTRLEDAFRLLERAAPQDYAMGATDHGAFWARVLVSGVTGEACESSQARALTLAVARALRLDIPEFQLPSRMSSCRDRQPSGSKRDV